MACGDPTTRRAILRALTTLPLVGGGISLIGMPTAAAEPVTRELLDSYDAWLFSERQFLKWERYRRTRAGEQPPGPVCAWYNPATDRISDIVPADNAGHRWHYTDDRRLMPQPSSRAAIVLSAVGCDWRQ
ncbi:MULTISPECIES: hypothetical protein [unclassified Methylobacterium]|uniref:hypothetical protein n=1 Tax=unclassified Methylobacterium TaxID=2615210 RepID=UPI00226A13FD|nr:MULTISPECIES: hypothetical protein [unclassified Methylobacterium]